MLYGLNHQSSKTSIEALDVARSKVQGAAMAKSLCLGIQSELLHYNYA